MIDEVILCKYGEIVLKGANRKYFEDMLCREIKKRAAAYGNFDVYRAQSTIYIEPKEENADMDGRFESASKGFGIVAISRAAVCEKNMEDISRVAAQYIPQFLRQKSTFKVEAKRSDKKFPLKSPEISAEIGGVILGVVLLRLIFVGLTFLGIDANMQYIIKGLIILLACAIDMRKYLVRK